MPTDLINSGFRICFKKTTTTVSGLARVSAEFCIELWTVYQTDYTYTHADIKHDSYHE